MCLVGAAGHASEAAGHGADTVCPSHLDADPMRDEIHLICIDAVEAHLIA